MRLRNKIVVGMIICLFVVNGTRAVDNFDWPQFRGPDRNGISKETAWNPGALSGGAKVAWKVNVGQGWSSVSICGDKLFTLGNVNDQDIVYALNVKDGKEIWRHIYPCRAGNYPGPRSTPATDGRVVYSISRDGEVSCLNIQDGKEIWKKNVLSAAGAENINWGIAGSPVIYGEMLICGAGDAGVAVNRKTGEKIWSSSGQSGYATPVVFQHGDKDLVTVFGGKGLSVVEAKTGKKMNFTSWETKYDVNAADPIPFNGKIFISSGYGRGCALIDVSSTQSKIIWEHTGMRNHFSSCVLINGDLYGIDGNTGSGMLKCMDVSTGNEKWGKNLGFGGLMAADNKLIVLNEGGDLFIVKASPAGFEEISSAKDVLDKTCWTAPVLCRGTIFCRNNKGDIVAVDVSK
jgi:outer membrane protein assembly factor BamB